MLLLRRNAFRRKALPATVNNKVQTQRCALESWLGSAISSPFEIESRLVPDEQPMIEQAICELVDERFCHLVLTTGGTGPARRDVTPDALRILQPFQRLFDRLRLTRQIEDQRLLADHPDLTRQNRGRHELQADLAHLLTKTNLSRCRS